MSFAAARALQNLRAFVLRDHALELHDQSNLLVDFIAWCVVRDGHIWTPPMEETSKGGVLR